MDPIKSSDRPRRRRVVFHPAAVFACAGALVLAAAQDLHAQPRTQPGQQPGRAQPEAAQAQPGIQRGAVRELAGDEVSFEEFTEPVDLQVLIDFIARRLQINFLMTDVAVAGRQVVFRAPMTVKNEQLLPLLQLLLESAGFSLTRDPEHGWYMIMESGKAPIHSPDDTDLATTQIFPTPMTRPSALQGAINTALGGESGQMKMSYVDELGVIISTGPQRLNRSVARIIELILQGQRNQRLHRFDLMHIAASEARDRILSLVGQITGGATARPAAREGAAGGGAGGGGAAASVGGVGAFSNLADRLILDPAGNSLIFRGDDADSVELKRLIELVDVPSRLIIRRYSAGRYSSRIASYGEKQGLGSVLGAGGGGAAGVGARAQTAAAGQQGPGLVGSGFLLDPEEEGSFTYFGTASQHDRVAALVEEFAEQVREAEMRVEFYKLKHARAVDAADLLNQLLDLDRGQTADSPFLPRGVEARGIRRIDPPQQRQPEPQPTRDPDRPAPADEDEIGITPVEGIAIIPDEANNQLIIRAPQRQQREFVRIIDSIDQRRPQVYIEVQIVSVSASKQFDFSIDYALGEGTPGSVPIFTNFGLRGDPFTTDLPNPAGITAAVIRSNYIPVIVNMLQTEGDGRILSTPRILVNDNEQARLDSTRDEPFATTSQVVGAPSQTGLGGTLSAGTSLTVTPQVSEAGFLILEFEVELSSFGERPNPDLPPATDRNVFSSAITIPSDSTVVVGGFTRESRTDSVNKVPFLGDIPGIGNLFRNISKMNSTQTIYVFITPRVLRDQSFTDMRLLAEGPMTQMNVSDTLPRLEAAIMPLRRRMEPARREDEPAVSRIDQSANDQAS